MTSPAYEAGIEAGKAGAEVWANPHVTPESLKSDTQAWFAGWCYGKQQRGI